MSGATGTAGGIGAEGQQASAQPATGGAHGPVTAGGVLYQGGTSTETCPPQPHHPPQAYQPPADSGYTQPQFPHQQYQSPQPQPQQTQQYQQQPQQQPQQYQPQAQPQPQSQAQVASAVRRPRPAARTVPRTRQARLRVAKADPWSVMKVSFLLSIALGICTIVAVTVLWLVLDGIGVFSTVGDTVSDATGSGTDGGFDLESFLSLSRVLLFTTIIAVIDVILATALATLGAFVYNISAGFVGGVELTLAEDE